MNRQNTMGQNPSSSISDTIPTRPASLASAPPLSPSARWAKSRNRRLTAPAAASVPVSAPGTTSAPSSGSSRSRTLDRPISSTSSAVSAPAVTARVRMVAAAAAGLDARARSSPRADHHRTRCRWRAAPGSLTSARA